MLLWFLYTYVKWLIHFLKFLSFSIMKCGFYLKVLYKNLIFSWVSHIFGLCSNKKVSKWLQRVN